MLKITKEIKTRAEEARKNNCLMVVKNGGRMTIVVDALRLHLLTTVKDDKEVVYHIVEADTEQLATAVTTFMSLSKVVNKAVVKDQELPFTTAYQLYRLMEESPELAEKAVRRLMANHYMIQSAFDKCEIFDKKFKKLDEIINGFAMLEAGEGVEEDEETLDVLEKAGVPADYVPEKASVMTINLDEPIKIDVYGAIKAKIGETSTPKNGTVTGIKKINFNTTFVKDETEFTAVCGWGALRAKYINYEEYRTNLTKEFGGDAYLDVIKKEIESL